MSISSQKAGNKFKKPIQHKGVLTPGEWVVAMLNAGWPASPKVLAEALGILEYESSFNASSPGDGTHIGGWQEDASFGSEAERLDPVASSRAALRNWQANGHSFHQAWGQWQEQQRPDHTAGNTNWRKFLPTVEGVLKRGNAQGSGSGGGGWISGFPDPGDLLEGAGGVVGGVTSAADFLSELASTILDFRKLGQLMAEALAWFLRLLLKALWDYAIAPLVHWGERATMWYWTNFFGTGTERGSGFGYQLRQNAGIITIGFWALGYAVLWSDGQSIAPVDAQGSMVGRAVKGIEGQIARRSLIKPDKVKEKTPPKPKPQKSTIGIDRVDQYAVSRNRSVRVSGGNSQNGKEYDERSEGQKQAQRIPKPGSAEQAPQIIIPEGQAKPQKEPKAQLAKVES